MRAPLAYMYDTTWWIRARALATRSSSTGSTEIFSFRLPPACRAPDFSCSRMMPRLKSDPFPGWNFNDESRFRSGRLVGPSAQSASAGSLSRSLISGVTIVTSHRLGANAEVRSAPSDFSTLQRARPPRVRHHHDGTIPGARSADNWRSRSGSRSRPRGAIHGERASGAVMAGCSSACASRLRLFGAMTFSSKYP